MHLAQEEAHGFLFQFLTSFGVIILACSCCSASSAIKVVQEYERGVIFLAGPAGRRQRPGLFFIIPIVDRMVKVDLRVVTLDIPRRKRSRDNVTVKVNAVAYFRVVDPSQAIVKVEDSPRDLADCADQFALGPGPVRPGRAAGPSRRNQPAASGHHRRADRAVGHQGQHRRGQGRGAARAHEARWRARPRPNAEARKIIHARVSCCVAAADRGRGYDRPQPQPSSCGTSRH